MYLFFQSEMIQWSQLICFSKGWVSFWYLHCVVRIVSWYYGSVVIFTRTVITEFVSCGTPQVRARSVSLHCYQSHSSHTVSVLFLNLFISSPHRLYQALEGWYNMKRVCHFCFEKFILQFIKRLSSLLSRQIYWLY